MCPERQCESDPRALVLAKEHANESHVMIDVDTKCSHSNTIACEPSDKALIVPARLLS